jgi:hypothetical protein
MNDRTADGAGGLGALVTETLDYDGGRQVTVYVPPDPPRAIVFAGDGQGVRGGAGLWRRPGCRPP